MEEEVEKKKKDLETTKKVLAEYEVKSHQEQHEKQKLELEYKKKLQTLEDQLQELKKRQKVAGLQFYKIARDFNWQSSLDNIKEYVIFETRATSILNSLKYSLIFNRRCDQAEGKTSTWTRTWRII